MTSSATVRQDKAFDPLIPTIFHEPWWLNAASNGAYDEVTVVSGHTVIGRLPFVVDRITGCWRICRMPELTHFLGPAILDNPNAGECNRIIKRAEVTRLLLQQLPDRTLFHQKMHAGVPDMIEFQKQGFDITVQFTFEINPENHEILWTRMRDKTRNVIRRAEEVISIKTINDPSEFILFYKTNLLKKQTKNLYTESILNSIMTESLIQRQGRIIGAFSKANELLAAVFYVWDASSAYFLMSTRNASSGNGAVSLLVWDALKDCSLRRIKFDFAGVGTTGSILFFTGFGGTVSPRYIARSSTFIYGLARSVVRPFRERGRREFFR